MSESPPIPLESPSDVLDDAERLLTSLETHADPAVREQVRELLEHIDAVHRTGLTHLINGVRGMAGEAFINRLTADPAVRLLLMSYDLIAIDRRIQVEEILDTVRAHLHAHGVDIELLSVVGGVVYVKLHGLPEHNVALGGVVRDLEVVLKEGLLGFQELVVRDHEPPPVTSKLVSIEGLRRRHRPVYHTVAAEADLPPGSLKAVLIGETPLLIANVAGAFYAVFNRCGTSPLPLEYSTLDQAVLTCSWHGCRYDLRTGQALDEFGEPLQVFPVRVHDANVEVAIGVELDDERAAAGQH